MAPNSRVVAAVGGVLVAAVGGVLVVRSTGATPPPVELHAIWHSTRDAGGELLRWVQPGHEHGVCAAPAGGRVEAGEPLAAEQTAFYVRRDGSDERGRKPRCEVVVNSAGAVVGWGYGSTGVCGTPPAGGRAESREPTAAEQAAHKRSLERAGSRRAAIRLMADATAARALGLLEDAARLEAESAAALAEANR